MSFANPAYLWAFTGLIIPFAIHLWSRREGKIIKVGSIKYFPRSESQKSRSIRLNEVILLLLRSVWVCLLVFALAGLKIPTNEVKKPAILVDSEVLQSGDYLELIDSLRLIGTEIRRFSSHFPVVDDTYDSSMTAKADYWDLIAAIDQLGRDSITVYSKSRIVDFRGDRSGLTTVVNWITLPNKQGQEHIVDAFETSSGLIKCLLVSATEELTRTEFQYLKDIDGATTRKSTAGEQVKLVNQNTWITIRKPENTNVSIWYDTEFRFDAHYIDAAMKACAEYIGTDIEIIHKPAVEFDSTELRGINVWLSETSPQDKNLFSLLYQPDEFTQGLIRPTSSQYYLTRRLNRNNVFDADLAASLLPILYDVSTLSDKIDNVDLRVLSTSQRKPISISKTSAKNERSSAAPLLWILIVLVLLGERIVSHWRKQ